METENEISNQSFSKMINIILFGAPGSGKGTQSSLIEQKYNFHHISTGELLREEIAKDSEVGKFAHGFISKGKLVPDDLIIQLLAKKFDELNVVHSNGIILDGFPRTVGQAEALEVLFEERGTHTDLLLDLRVDEEELINRLLLRGQTSGRNDDNMDIIHKRISIYNNQTRPVVDFYEKLGRHVEIDGIGSVEEIFEKISNAIDGVK